jgi:Beta-lactamase
MIYRCIGALTLCLLLSQSVNGSVVSHKASQQGTVSLTRAKFGYDFFFSDATFSSPASMAAYTPLKSDSSVSPSFQGRLQFTLGQHASHFETIKDDFEYLARGDTDRTKLPRLDFEFVQNDDVLIPTVRTPVTSDHPSWDYIIGPGRLWREGSDNGFTRASIPFALQEKNANCVHNGALTFLVKANGDISQTAFQISSETCFYFKFTMWGKLNSHYQPYTVEHAKKTVDAHQRELRARLPTKPMKDLAIDYPGAAPNRFGDVSEIAATDMTLYGFIIDGKHYVGGCQTRHGRYPFCDELALPSYSTAKTVVAGLSLMRLEKMYPGIANQAVSDFVPQCSGEQWRGVSLVHLLDMSTGNYDQARADLDEAAPQVGGLFDTQTHLEKITYSCNAYPRKSTPGTRWVYHTSDTYILGAAINQVFKQRHGRLVDFYDDMLLPQLWQPLTLSPLMTFTRRTQDLFSQPFTGWGLTFLRDDVAKLSTFLNVNQGRIGEKDLLEPSMLAAAMQLAPNDRGMIARDSRFRYQHGFWGHDVKPYLGCENATWVPFMSGYGGIIVLMLPNDTSYYYFSDGGEHRWSHAAIESHNIRKFCQ